jgi:hypothetical protein
MAKQLQTPAQQAPQPPTPAATGHHATAEQQAESQADLIAGLKADGFARLPGAQVRDMLGYGEAELAAFLQSWDDLPMDAYMADGGDYRRRRYAAFAVRAGSIARMPHQPHYQDRAYNPLNGGTKRWFAAATQLVGDHPLTQRLLELACAVIDSVDGPQQWNVEFHQFRIEARPGKPGLPTPEGVHRDGVDWVLNLAVGRKNIDGGASSIHKTDGEVVCSFTLDEMLDLLLIDDRRVMHGVTPIVSRDSNEPAYRDMLVITFSAAERSATAITA